MQKDDKLDINDEIFKVKLKPILGIVPKIYCLLMLLILFLILLFIFLINPKIKNPGSYLHIKTNINNAHVYLDEKYLGRTPLNKYINIAKGTLRIKRLGFDTYEEQIEIQNRFFTSYNFNVKLELVDPDKIINQRQKELSIMTKIKNTNDNIQTIPIFSLILNDFKNSTEHIKKFFKTSIPYLNSSSLFKDFMKVYKEIYSIKNNSNKDIWESLQQNFNLEKRSIIWFFQNLDKEQQKQISNEAWFKTLIEELKNEKKILTFENKNINLDFKGFKKINSEIIESTEDYKLSSHNITIKTAYKLKEFLIQNQNITKAEYQIFLNENPKWKLNNKDNLIKEELVDERYLKNFVQIASNEDITDISYYAALEYARWYSSTLPKGFTARLPLSQEWELYQRKEPKSINHLNINEISQKVGFWNLMQNSNFNDTLLFKDKNQNNIYCTHFNSLITEVRTYKYKDNSILKPSTKASFLKNWSSPNIGFRLIIEKE
ncbi:PEGA domain-containing protein [Borrelia sp. A-FGy1]|uniref:SUMF1/EgtB/PvdO family nonheme iron enzyme n=1 Tax=Borrelia sp. A-FGy1 TaxID=2608247 RepID=UPI0015F60434|nr:SUMF1/EgtB/PvdO family nonheme iron enzyme [Borrelia sp. A-FGy1]QMU98851.1 PEGA domain-containing protein [Borrelia sp. A-FGy1]